MDWRDVVRGDVQNLPATSADPEDRSATAAFKIPVYRLLLEASRRRRISVPAYVRRAVMAFVAHDLGAPLSTLVKLDPRMARENGYLIRDEEGDAFGPWQILALVPREGADVGEMPDE